LQIWVTDNKEITPQWLAYTVRVIFQQIYKVWKCRCEVNHGNTERDKRKRDLLRLAPQVAKLYHLQEQIEQTDSQIFAKSEAETLELPSSSIEHWIFKAKLRIQASIKRRKQREKGLTQSIHPFFSTGTQTNTKHKVACPHTNKHKRLTPTFVTQYFSLTKNSLRSISEPKSTGLCRSATFINLKFSRFQRFISRLQEVFDFF
jgi:hypothetical protein